MSVDPVKAFLKSRGSRPDLVAGGWPGLVGAWRETVRSIEAGYALTADDYLNDMDLRQTLEEASPLVSPAAREEVLRLDRAARPHLKPAPHCLWGDAAARKNGWTPRANWWYFAVPAAAPGFPD